MHAHKNTSDSHPSFSHKCISGKYQIRAVMVVRSLNLPMTGRGIHRFPASVFVWTRRYVPFQDLFQQLACGIVKVRGKVVLKNGVSMCVLPFSYKFCIGK